MHLDLWRLLFCHFLVRHYQHFVLHGQVTTLQGLEIGSGYMVSYFYHIRLLLYTSMI
jgi:hypothetical protein